MKSSQVLYQSIIEFISIHLLNECFYFHNINLEIVVKYHYLWYCVVKLLILNTKLSNMKGVPVRKNNQKDPLTLNNAHFYSSQWLVGHLLILNSFIFTKSAPRVLPSGFTIKWCNNEGMGLSWCTVFRLVYYKISDVHMDLCDCWDNDTYKNVIFSNVNILETCWYTLHGCIYI